MAMNELLELLRRHDRVCIGAVDLLRRVWLPQVSTPLKDVCRRSARTIDKLHRPNVLDVIREAKSSTILAAAPAALHVQSAAAVEGTLAIYRGFNLRDDETQVPAYAQALVELSANAALAARQALDASKAPGGAPVPAGG